jgi:hypothetical protein
MKKSGATSEFAAEALGSARLHPDLAEDHDWHGPGHDGEVLDRRAFADVLEIQLDLPLHVFDVRVVAEVDLGPSGDPRQNLLSRGVVRQLVAQLREDLGLLGAGSGRDLAD